MNFELIEAFSQNKDELILSFLNGREEFHIKALLSTQFACLTFPEEFARARKNSINLFPEILELKVTGIHQFKNERSFSILFEKGFQLLFKMHGKRSNIILYRDGQQVTLFNSQMKFDLSLNIKNLDRHINQSKENFLKNGIDIYPTFDKNTKHSLALSGFNEEKTAENYQIVQQILKEMERDIYIFTEKEGEIPKLSLFPPATQDTLTVKNTSDPIKASNEFYYQYTKIFFLTKEQDHLIRLLNKKIKQSNNYLKKTFDKLQHIEDTARHKELADILMANIHQIPANKSNVVLFDFYKNEEIKIKIKKDLSPQKNAEIYYRKSKNQKIEIDKLYENLQTKESEKSKLEALLAQISTIESLKDLRKFAKQNKLIQHHSQQEEVETFKKYTIDEWVILIGRNAKNNDLLTQKFAHKDDLWLHAKDVSGSHVIIKNLPGKEFPKNVIEKAAQLAAYYSKRKNDSLCPVIFTPKKYVRKPKGMIAGQVIVDREEVVLVEPLSLKEIPN